MTTRKRVKILVDIIANQVGILLPNELHAPFVDEAWWLIEVYFERHKTTAPRNAVEELAAIENALFHVTGSLRKWLNNQEGIHHAQERSGSRGPGE